MKNTAIIAVITLFLGAGVGAYLTSGIKDKKQAEAVSAAVDAEKAACAALKTELDATKLAAEMAAFRIRLGTLAIEAARLNYGTAKDAAVSFFTDLTAFAERAKGTEHEAKVAAILEKRDVIVSELSIGSPTAAEMLQRLYLDLN